MDITGKGMDEFINYTLYGSDSNTSENILDNLGNLLPFCENKTSQNDTSTGFQLIIYVGVIPTLCVIGILGNILNLAILTHRSWKNLGHLELFAHSGLVALATADMGVCLSVLPWFFIGEIKSETRSNRITFPHIFEAFSSLFINIFILASTLFTVSLAIGRYYAIRWPIEMRTRMNSKLTRIIIAAVICASISLNIPRIWTFTIRKCSYPGDSNSYYEVVDGPLSRHTPQMIYLSIYFAIAIAIPLLTLTFCNIFLLRNIHKSMDNQLKSTYHFGQGATLRRKQEEAGRLMTLVLAIIVIMHIVLVTPSEILSFLRHFLELSSNSQKNLVVVVNALEILNFASNFVLYCTLNAQFRRIIRQSIKKCVTRFKSDEYNVKDNHVTEETSLCNHGNNITN